MLVASFALLLVINAAAGLERARAQGGVHERHGRRPQPTLAAAPRRTRPRRPPPSRAWVRCAADRRRRSRSSTLFLFVPLAAVFAEALREGLGRLPRGASPSPTRCRRIRLTLLAAAIAVPLNLVFGVAAAWAIAKFDFRGKSLLITLIDLPFSVSPVIAGLIYVLLFGAAGLVRRLARASTTSRSSSPCPASCWRRSSSPSRSSRAS